MSRWLSGSDTTGFAIGEIRIPEGCQQGRLLGDSCVFIVEEETGRQQRFSLNSRFPIIESLLQRDAQNRSKNVVSHTHSLAPRLPAPWSSFTYSHRFQQLEIARIKRAVRQRM